MPLVDHDRTVVEQLQTRFGAESFTLQPTVDGIPTLWVAAGLVHDALSYLKRDVERAYETLFDLTAIDERVRTNRGGQPASDFTVVYHLLSYDRNSDVRLKVPLVGEAVQVRSVVDLWGSANWYEREAYDMFGLKFEGHPNLRRILMPPWWEGHPLRKDHPARATEMGPFRMSEEQGQAFQADLTFRPEDWGMTPQSEDEEYVFLNLGPQHPGTHGPFRVALQLAGEEVVGCVPDIGFHHRGAEKMGERQSWHTYIPYTDRVDYLGGVMNNLAYLTPLEQLAGIVVPDRAKVIRIMLSELFRISSHLVWYGTFAQDVGAMSPVFYMFNDRERLLEIVEAITGFRMHPAWFRIGGTAADLPNGWDRLVRDFIAFFRPKLDEYDALVLDNSIFRGRTMGIGRLTPKEAVEWGATGPMLRATGIAWDFRKKRPYGGYDQFDFEVPTATGGDAYSRAVVHVGELRQSLRIVEQCLNSMPSGPYKADHPLTTPPVKQSTMRDIETLINHFLGVSWGPVMPVGESTFTIEGTKGAYAYYLVSDGDSIPYRVRIRSASFPHIQLLPRMVRGATIPDLAATLGSIDFVLADVDR